MPFATSSDLLVRNPPPSLGSSELVAVTCKRRGSCRLAVSVAMSAIAWHEAWLAASSCSGLVRPSGRCTRDAHVNR